MNIVDRIESELQEARDEKYKGFHSSLLPSVNPETILGVRTPVLRRIAKKYKNAPDIDGFLGDLPHKYYDENAIHSFIISETKDFEESIAQVKEFLPFIDNWAICDSLTPRAFKNERQLLLPHIYTWISTEQEYTVRFAIKMLMDLFLDDLFDVKYMELVSLVKSDKYYVNMMIAWYFATALAKQKSFAISYIEEKSLSPWVHNKAIQKGVESYRITSEDKEYLKTLRIK